MIDTIMRALIDDRRNRLRSAWFMFTACRAHGLGYGLTFREWFPGAWWSAVGELKGARK